MSESCVVAVDEGIRKERHSFAPVQVDGQETPLSNVYVPKPRIRKPRQWHVGRLNQRIRVAYNAPKKRRLLGSSLLMPFEKSQRKIQQRTAICFEAHSSLHDLQVCSQRSRREPAQGVLTLCLGKAVAAKGLEVTFQSSRSRAFFNAFYGIPRGIWNSGFLKKVFAICSATNCGPPP